MATELTARPVQIRPRFTKPGDHRRKSPIPGIRLTGPRDVRLSPGIDWSAGRARNGSARSQGSDPSSTWRASFLKRYDIGWYWRDVADGVVGSTCTQDSEEPLGKLTMKS